MDLLKDRKFIGKEFNWKNKEKVWKVKLKEITLDGNYCFITRSKDCEWEEIWTKVPNDGDIEC